MRTFLIGAMIWLAVMVPLAGLFLFVEYSVVDRVFQVKQERDLRAEMCEMGVLSCE